MADLTDEEKIVIGVCVGVGGLVLIAIICLLCYICLCQKPQKKRKRRHYIKERIIDDYRPPPYNPIPIPYPPPRPRPLPPPLPAPLPPPVVKIPTPAPIKVDYTDPYRDTEYRYKRWDGVFRNDPIVISMAEPEIQTDGRYLQDPDTIYLKYNDDQALLRTQNYQRRAEYALEYAPQPAMVSHQSAAMYSQPPPPPPAPIRRARSLQGLQSFTVTKRETPYVGEWYRRPDNLNGFNENALRKGRDPFLWS